MSPVRSAKQGEMGRYDGPVGAEKHARNCRSSEPKDKVYAFIGPVGPEYGIIANYNPAYSINSVLTEAIIKTEQNRGHPFRRRHGGWQTLPYNWQ
jgi:hypothetical protein